MILWLSNIGHTHEEGINSATSAHHSAILLAARLLSLINKKNRIK